MWQKHSDQDSNKYVGEYKDDMKHGKGEFTWASGGNYKGDYIDDVKEGFGEMTWADGSVYSGTWQGGVQNGIGLMKFASGLKKAGSFKDNVMMEIITEEAVEQYEQQTKKQLPAEFKLLLTECIEELKPTDDHSPYIDKELKKNQVEEKTQPNTLLQMQEAVTSPFGRNTGVTKEMFVSQVKARDAETQYETRLSLNAKPAEDETESQLIYHDFDYVGYEVDANLNKDYDKIMQSVGKQTKLRSPAKSIILSGLTPTSQVGKGVSLPDVPKWPDKSMQKSA